MDKHTYDPYNLIDGDLKTSWQESGQGKKEGQWIFFTFKSPVDLYGLDIANGFQTSDEKNGDLYYKNSRLKVAKIYVNDSKSGKTIELEDTKNIEKFPFKASDVLNLKLEIIGEYKGDKWDDLAISEITFYGSIKEKGKK